MLKINSISNDTIYACSGWISRPCETKIDLNIVICRGSGRGRNKNGNHPVKIFVLFYNRCHILHSISFVFFLRPIGGWPTDRVSSLRWESRSSVSGLTNEFLRAILSICIIVPSVTAGINEEQEKRWRRRYGGGKKIESGTQCYFHTYTPIRYSPKK